MTERGILIMKLTRAVPIARQLKEILRARILDGYYSPHTRIPSESALAAEFGVSRSSIRGALSQLAGERLLIRRPGDGTYINQSMLQFSLNVGSLWEFSRHIEATGRKASIRPLSAQVRPAAETEAATLHLAPGDEVLSVTVLFLADERPVTLVENVIPRRLLLQEVQLQEANVPFDEFMQRYCGRQLSFAILEVSATLADKALAEVLSLDAGSALLCIDVVFFDQDSLPVAGTLSYFRDKASSLRIPIALE